MNQSSTKSNCLGFRNNVVSTRNQPIVNSNQPVGFLEFNDNRQQIIKFDNTFNYNPVSKILTVQNINATTNHASSITITNDTTSNSTFYLTFVDNDGVEKNLKINKSGISYNPSTNLLTLTGALTSNSIITGGITCSGILMDGNLTGDGTNNMTAWNTITCNTITANFLVGNGSLLTNVFANFSAKTDKILTATTSLDINFNLLFQPSVLAVDGYESILFNSGITFNPSSKILKLSQTTSYLQAHGANNTFGYFGGGNAVPGTGATNPWIATISGGNNTIGQAVYGWLFYNSSSTGDLTINRRNNSTTDVNVMTFVRGNGNCGIGLTTPLEKLVSSGTVRALGGTISNEPSATMAYEPNLGGFWSYAGTMSLACRGINSSTLGAMGFVIATSTFSSHIIAMYIKQNGYVGIGNTAPESKLHVSAGDIGVDRDFKFSLGAGYSSAWFLEQTASDNFFHITRKGEALGPAINIKTNNNVGIGVANPGEKLEVSGTTVSGSANTIAFDCVTNNTNYGLFIGGANTFNSTNGSMFVTPNLHIDAPIGNGSLYLQYFNSTYTVIRNRIDISDKRIKKDIIKIEEQSQFNDVFDLIKKVGSYTYKYTDTYRENDLDQYGFIAQEVLEHYPVASKLVGPDCYLPNIMETLEYEYTVDDDKNYNFTIEGYELDINIKYLFYAFIEGDYESEIDFDYLENIEPTSENSFSYKPVVNRAKKLPTYRKLVLVGTYTNDKLGVFKDKLFQLGFAGTNALIIENENLKERVNQLENDLLLIKSHLNI